jgi:Glycosyl hydrolases family 18
MLWHALCHISIKYGSYRCGVDFTVVTQMTNDHLKFPIAMKRYRPVVLLLLHSVEQLLFLHAGTVLSEKKEDGAAAFRIAGYLPDYRFHDINLNETMKYLDDVYLFSLSPQTQLGDFMFQACCLQPSHFEALKSLSHPKPKFWVTVGGAGRSNKLTKAPSAMMRALARLVLDDYPSLITGIDFDCELFLEHSDYENYDKLVTAATNIFPPQGIAVSMALHVNQHKAFPQAVQKVDRINLMTYGMPSATYHADFTKMREAVEGLLVAGVPAKKIFVGVPAYGVHTASGETKAYHELARETNNGPARRHKIYNYGGFLVDSPAAIQAKVRFAVSKGLGGVFFWELGQDKDHVLLAAAARQAGKHVSPVSASSPAEKTTVLKAETNHHDEL